jgi:hypothetical protein
VRRFATEARISFGSAGSLLRSAAQHAATLPDDVTPSLCGESAAEIRAAIGRAVKGLVATVEDRLRACQGQGKLDASGVERLTRAMETALRVADSLDGLAHDRSLEAALVKKADAETLERMLAPPAPSTEGWDGSVDEWLKRNEPPGLLRIVPSDNSTPEGMGS